MEKKNLKDEKIEKSKKVEEVELQPSWSKLKSFHSKAMVGTKENGNKYLKSFGFLVAEIIDGKVKIHNEIEKWDSKTTVRHINNFLFENGLQTGNIKELTELYITKTKKAEQIENKKETKSADDEKAKNKKIENSKINEKLKETKTIENKTEKSKIEKSKDIEKEVAVEVGA